MKYILSFFLSMCAAAGFSQTESYASADTSTLKVSQDTIRVMLAINTGKWMTANNGEQYEIMGVRYAYEVRKVTFQMIDVSVNPNHSLPGGGMTLMGWLPKYELRPVEYEHIKYLTLIKAEYKTEDNIFGKIQVK